MSTPFPINFAGLPVGLNPTALFDQGFAAATDGQYMQDGTLPVSALAPATAGYALIGNGAGVAPSFQIVTVNVANISGLGAGVGAFLATPSSANLAAALTDETGTGAAVFATNPVLVTPNLGTPSAVNLANGTNLPATALAGLGAGVAAWLATPSSANLAAAVTDETGTGALVFADTPSFLGTPRAPTASTGTNTTQIATTAFVQAAIAAYFSSLPTTLPGSAGVVWNNGGVVSIS